MITVLYGVNNATEICFDRYTNKSDVVVVTTNGGESFGSFQSISLREFAELDYAVIDRVIICSSFVGEIAGSLLDVAFPIERIFCFDTCNVVLSPCRDIVQKRIERDDVLYAFYDLSNNWVTFDCVAFCVLADLERRRLSKKYIHFVIVPDVSADADSVGAFRSFSDADRSWRVDHILRTVFSCVPNAAGISTLVYREEADYYATSGVDCFPSGYLAGDPAKNFAHSEFLQPKSLGHDLSVFQAPAMAVSMVEDYLAKISSGRKVIAINLRESDVQSSRNSSLSDWACFCRSLDRNVYCPVIVRDFYSSLEPLPAEFGDVPVLHHASADFAIRVALYQLAHLNMSITNGAFYITNFMKNVRSVTFVELDNENPCMSETTWNSAGYTVGEDASFRDNDDQQVFWGRDTIGNIKIAFDRIESRPGMPSQTKMVG